MRMMRRKVSRQIGMRYMRCMAMRWMGINMLHMDINMLHIQHSHPGEEEAEIEAKALAVSIIPVGFFLILCEGAALRLSCRAG